MREDDKMIWKFTNNGQYTAKSGYHLHRDLVNGLEGEKDKLVWKVLWKLRLAPAIKMLIWRDCSEALPSLANLRDLDHEE